MTTKKRPKTPASKSSALSAPPNVLNDEALADLNYLEPKRTRDRVIACFNEAFARIMQLERMHAPEHEAAERKRR